MKYMNIITDLIYARIHVLINIILRLTQTVLTLFFIISKSLLKIQLYERGQCGLQKMKAEDVKPKEE